MAEPRFHRALPESEKRRQRSWERREQRELIDGRWTTTEPGVAHGLESTYVNWSCRCVPCTAANAAKQAAYRKRRMRLHLRTMVDGRWVSTARGAVHGLYTTYDNWGCRCVPCTQAMAGSGRFSREQRRART